MSKSERYSDTNLAYLMLRATLGLNICIHGVSRILQGSGVFANSLVGSFPRRHYQTGPFTCLVSGFHGSKCFWAAWYCLAYLYIWRCLEAPFSSFFYTRIFTASRFECRGPATYLRHDLCRIVSISGQRLRFGGLPVAHRRPFLSYAIQST